MIARPKSSRVDREPIDGRRFAKAGTSHPRAAQAKGKADCDSVLADDPRHAKAHFRRATCCLKLDDWAEAKASFKRCLAVDPANKDAAKGLRALADLAKKQNARDKKKFNFDKVAKAINQEDEPARAAAPPAAAAAAPTIAAAVAAATAPARRRALAALGVAVFLWLAASAWFRLTG